MEGPRRYKPRSDMDQLEIRGSREAWCEPGEASSGLTMTTGLDHKVVRAWRDNKVHPPGEWRSEPLRMLRLTPDPEVTCAWCWSSLARHRVCFRRSRRGGDSALWIPPSPAMFHAGGQAASPRGPATSLTGAWPLTSRPIRTDVRPRGLGPAPTYRAPRTRPLIFGLGREGDDGG